MSIDTSVISVFLMLAGPFVGSFLSAETDRRAVGLADGKSWRSQCKACRKPLSVLELIPVASYLLQRGKCRDCGAAIDPIHPVAETAALVVGVCAVAFTPQGYGYAVAAAFLGWFLLFVAVFDAKTRRIPDIANVVILVAGLVWALGVQGRDWQDVAWAVLFGGGGLALVAVLFRRIRGYDGLGWGDVKLSAALSVWIGGDALPVFWLLSSLSAIGFLLLTRERELPLRATTALPFGPFLCLVAWGLTLLSWNGTEASSFIGF